jgi:hypothetical protein
MTSLRLLLLAALLCLGPGLRAQTPTAKPGPEHAQLQRLAGEWKYEGLFHRTPLGEAGAFKGRQSSRMILNGFFLENRWKDKGDYGPNKGVVFEGVEILGYDAQRRCHTITMHEADGAVSQGTITIQGDTWVNRSTRTGADGTVYQVRFVTTFNSNGKRVALEGELSRDGIAWMPWAEITMTKVREAR